MSPSNVDPDALTRFTMGTVGAELITRAGQRTVIDTDLGTIWQTTTNGLTSLRTGEGLANFIGFEKVSPTLSVMGVAGFSVVEASTLEVYGTRSLVLMVTGPATIAGRVRVDGGICDAVNARPGCNGAGGGWGGAAQTDNATGCAPGGKGAVGPRETGGGGGGMATAGGAGGTSGTSVGGAGGIEGACGDERLVPLVGGGGGGKGGLGKPNPNGGGGGGALQITSFTSLRLTSSAVLSAVGAGGQGTTTANNGGGGGGAGGAILLEAPTVTIDAAAVVSAAGGGGGGGRLTGKDGEAGRTDGMPALGGVGDGVNGLDGLGGNGAVDASDAQAGRSDAGGTLDGTGGGGGGLGRIRINSVKADAAEGAGFVGRYSAGRTGRR